MTLWVKGCPRCQGDIYLERDIGLPEINLKCLQCSHYLSYHEASLLENMDPNVLNQLLYPIAETEKPNGGRRREF